MKTLQDYRKELDALDGQLLALFEARMRVVSEIASLKIREGRAIRSPAREAEILDRVRASASPAIAPHAVALFEALLRESRAYQEALGK